MLKVFKEDSLKSNILEVLAHTHENSTLFFIFQNITKSNYYTGCALLVTGRRWTQEDTALPSHVKTNFG